MSVLYALAFINESHSFGIQSVTEYIGRVANKRVRVENKINGSIIELLTHKK